MTAVCLPILYKLDMGHVPKLKQFSSSLKVFNLGHCAKSGEIDDI